MTLKLLALSLLTAALFAQEAKPVEPAPELLSKDTVIAILRAERDAAAVQPVMAAYERVIAAARAVCAKAKMELDEREPACVPARRPVALPAPPMPPAKAPDKP